MIKMEILRNDLITKLGKIKIVFILPLNLLN